MVSTNPTQGVVNSKDFKGAHKVGRETGQGLPRSELGGGRYDQNTLHTSMNF